MRSRTSRCARWRLSAVASGLARRALAPGRPGRRRAGVRDRARRGEPRPTPIALERLLQALAAFGVFRREDDGRFGQTPASDLLRSDHPTRSARGSNACSEARCSTRGPGSSRRSGPGGRRSTRATASSWVEYYREHEDAGALFADAMSATTRAFEDGLLAAEPFPSFAFAVDVGGSQGSLLRRLLERNPDARGAAVRPARGHRAWRAEQPDDLGGRLSTAAGDFFERCRRAATSTCSSSSCTTGTTSERWRSCAASARRRAGRPDRDRRDRAARHAGRARRVALRPQHARHHRRPRAHGAATSRTLLDRRDGGSSASRRPARR